MCIRDRVSTAWWNGLEHFSLPDTDWIAVPITLVFLVLLRKKKIGPVQAILTSGVVGAVFYGLFQVPVV